MSRVTEVAHLLGVDQATARRFCLQVQGLCDKPTPSFHEILLVLTQHPESKSDPAEVARKFEAAPRPPRISGIGGVTETDLLV